MSLQHIGDNKKQKMAKYLIIPDAITTTKTNITKLCAYLIWYIYWPDSTLHNNVLAVRSYDHRNALDCPYTNAYCKWFS